MRSTVLVLFTLSCIVVVTSGDKANHAAIGNVIVGKPSPRQLKQQQPAAHEAPAFQPRFSRFRSKSFSSKPVQRKSYKPQKRNTIAGRGLFAANKPVKKSRAVAAVNPLAKLWPQTQSRNGNGNFRFAHPRPAAPVQENRRKTIDANVPSFVYSKAEDIQGYEKFTLDEVVYPARANERVDDVKEEQSALHDVDGPQSGEKKAESEQQQQEQQQQEQQQQQQQQQEENPFERKELPAIVLKVRKDLTQPEPVNTQES